MNINLLKKITASLFLILTWSILLQIPLSHATDVTAPSKDNVFTLTVKNIGSEVLEGVNITASLIQNPDGLVTIKEKIKPQNVKITANSSQHFDIKFDVGCPPKDSDKTETAKLKFTISKTTQGLFYIKGCGINPTTDCAELEAEFTVEEKLDKCHECKDGELVQKEDDGNECTEYSLDPETDECKHTPKKLSACQECQDGQIVPKDCGESSKCTTVSCDPETGCKTESDPNCDKDNSDPTYIQLPRGGDTPPLDESPYQFSQPPRQRRLWT